MRLTILFGVLSMTVIGCAQSPRSYETTPVNVVTAQGVVTCQLYSPEILVWDRSISRPSSMDHEEADAICLEEGRRQQRAN